MANTYILEWDSDAAPTPEAVIAFAKEHGCQMVDLRFTDLPGTWQHFSIPMTQLNSDVFSDGLGFDGSSIRGFQHINESDMLVIPDPSSAFIDPNLKVTTLVLICNVVFPGTMEPYNKDPRHVASKAEQYLISTGIADTIYIGPEVEFFIFNDVRFDQNVNSGYYFIDSDEGVWNTGDLTNKAPNLGFRPRLKGGYYPVPPTDQLQDVRSNITLKLQSVGIEVEVHHHEVGTAGQAEIDMRFDTLTLMADHVMKYKYVVRQTCVEHGLTATFMPKPLFQDNGSGMHVHQSLWRDGTNLFYDANGYALLSDQARWYIGGLLKHAAAVLAFAAPTTNSYRRLVPGYEAPVYLAYSERNRSAMIRIPTYSESPGARRLEFRPPDPSCNPYYAFAACLMAGLDGIQNKIEPPEPQDVDLYELSPEEIAKIQAVPGSLQEALNALEADQEFLLKGDVFTQDLIDSWLDYKRTEEDDQVRLRPHPYEFFLYYDV
jgi:glutamine synthetase